MDKLKKSLSFSVNMASDMIKGCISMGSSKDPSRTMKYPYTLTAKMSQFPYKWHLQNQWIFKYYHIACVICLPFFYWMQINSNSPANVAKWEEIRRKDREPHH